MAFFSLFLGLPIPPQPHLAPECSCKTPFDAAGHHRMSCPRHLRATAIRGHDAVVHNLIDIARSLGISCGPGPGAVPSHSGQKRADVSLDIRVPGEGEQIIGDVSVRHPVQGVSRDAGTVGKWLPSALSQRYSAKELKHGKQYRGMGLCFLPLVVSSFGVLQDDFLRLLWILAGKCDVDDYDSGEVRERALDSPRHHFFFKLRSRVAMGAARAASMRLVGVPGPVHYQRAPLRFYDPSDPSFMLPSALCGMPLGAFPLDSDDARA